jgi:hypothetical protein
MPRGLRAYPQKDRVLLAWEAAADNGRPLTGYNLYRSGSAGAETLYKKGLSPAVSVHFPGGVDGRQVGWGRVGFESARRYGGARDGAAVAA